MSTKFSRDEFKDFANCLVGLTDITYRVSGVKITEEQFLEGMASKDAALAPKIRAWLAAGREMAEHVRARQDVPAGPPVEVAFAPIKGIRF